MTLRFMIMLMMMMATVSERGLVTKKRICKKQQPVPHNFIVTIIVILSICQILVFDHNMFQDYFFPHLKTRTLLLNADTMAVKKTTLIR